MPGSDAEDANPSVPSAPTDTGAAEAIERGACASNDAPPAPSLELIARTDTDAGLGPSALLIELLDGVAEAGRYWAVGQGGLMSFDTTGESPELGDVFDGLSGRFYRLLLVDHEPPLAYVTHRDSGLQVVDRSDPSGLALVHTVLMDGLGGMVQQGDRIYVTRHDGALVVFDASNPAVPEPIGTTEVPGHPWNAVASVDTLYTADNTHGLGVFSLENPDSPALVGHVDIGSGALDLDIEGSTLFVAAGSAGLVLMDISTPDDPVERGRLWTGSPIVDVSVDGSTVWLVDHEAVWAVDASAPDRPVVIGRMTTPRFAMTVSAFNEEAWVGDWTAVGGYRANKDSSESTIVAQPDTLRMASERHTATVQLINLGPTAGEIIRWDASDPDAHLAFPQSTIESEGSLSIELTWPEDSDNGQFCVQTTDPTTPTLTVNVQRADPMLSVPLGAAAPDFELPSLDGERVRLSEQLGHPVLLVYFATW